jgi:hypothetical protein
MDADHKLLERLVSMVEYVPDLERCEPTMSKDPSMLVTTLWGDKRFVLFDPLTPYNPTRDAIKQLSDSAESCNLGDWMPEPLASATCRDYLVFAKRALREIEKQKIQPVFKMVDTCAGEFESATPYYYGTFETEDDAVRA